MNNNKLTAVLKELTFDTELRRLLAEGTPQEKEQALLGIALSNKQNEKALELFLKHLQEPETSVIAYKCLNKYLENATRYPLTRVLPVLIKGLEHPSDSVRYNCQSALDNLVNPANMPEGTLTFESFGLSIGMNTVRDYLDTYSPEKIIIGLLYLFHNPHRDKELYQVLSGQLAKDIPAVNCVIGSIIDTKLSSVIRQISAVGELSLNSFAVAQSEGLKSKASWVYRRFDSIRELAREHLRVMHVGV